MTQAPPREPAAPPKTLRRSGEGRFLMGVCAGLGRHTGIDPVVFRVGFVVIMFGSGIGLFLYIAAFLLMKEPSGKPGFVEQWTRRDFDADTVLALMTGVLALGLMLNLSTVWLGTGTLVVGIILAISLLTAHAAGVDLLGLARSMPERLGRRAQRTDLAEPPATEVAPVAPPRAAPTVSDREILKQDAPFAETAAYPTAAAHPTPPEPPTWAAAAPSAVPGSEPASEAVTARSPSEPAPEPVAAASEPPAGETPPHRVGADEDLTPYGTDAYGTGADGTGADGTRVSGTGTYGTGAGKPEPRTATRAAYGEPFAPRGPYRPLDPARRAGHSPYDPALYGRPPVPPVPPVPPKRTKRPKSFIGFITIMLAIFVGGIVVAVQATSPSGVHPTLVGGAMLVTIGAGLLVAAWWGRGAGLVGVGTVIAMLIGVGLMFGGLPSKMGESSWTPKSPAEAARLYDVGVGEGRLDLSELVLAPGSSVTFNASISVGQLTVIVPPTARIEVHATNKVGDIQIDQTLRGGVDLRFDKVLDPEIRPKGKVATIVLRLKGGASDLEVRRAA